MLQAVQWGGAFCTRCLPVVLPQTSCRGRPGVSTRISRGSQFSVLPSPPLSAVGQVALPRAWVTTPVHRAEGARALGSYRLQRPYFTGPALHVFTSKPWGPRCTSQPFRRAGLQAKEGSESSVSPVLRPGRFSALPSLPWRLWWLCTRTGKQSTRNVGAPHRTHLGATGFALLLFRNSSGKSCLLFTPQRKELQTLRKFGAFTLTFFPHRRRRALLRFLGQTRTSLRSD